jgi:hypothetical protein
LVSEAMENSRILLRAGNALGRAALLGRLRFEWQRFRPARESEIQLYNGRVVCLQTK